ncbi:MAG: O-antigen ligase family protein [Ruegeria sp.]
MNRTATAPRYLAGQTEAPLPALIWVYIMVLLIPIEFSLNLGGLLITPVRGFLLIVAGPVFYMFFTRRKFTTEDGLMVFFALWVFTSYLTRKGFANLDQSGQRFLEIMVSYCITRTFFTNRQQMISYSQLLAVVIAILGFLAIPEAITHYRFLHEVPELLTGFYYYISDDTRMNMLRAATTFEHPILFGLFAASSMSMLWFSTQSTGRRLWRTVTTGIASFFSLSSAAILVFGLQMALITMEFFTRKIPRRLTLFTVGTTAIVIFLETASNRGAIGLIASYLTFSAHTAYYRILQWNFTIDDVMRNPLFGVRYSEWTRPYWLTDSIDNNWLFIAFENGIPAVVALFALYLVIFLKVLKRARATKDMTLRGLEMGWIIAAISLFLGGWTVTFFGKMTPYFSLFLGMGSALARMPATSDQTDTPPDDQTDTVARANTRSRYTRFSGATPGGATLRQRQEQA